MRHILASLLLLSACATAPVAPVAPTDPTAPTDPAPPPLSVSARMLMAAGGADAASLSAAERQLGNPDIRRQDGAGAALTYRLESCALLLVFVADAQSELRLAEAHATARRSGAEAPSLQQCAAEADARKQQ